jgi:hypothetical protein
VLIDAFGRVRTSLHDLLGGLDKRILTERPAEGANPIGWITWHLTRVQDDHISVLADQKQVWFTQGWSERFNLPFDVVATGYGHMPAETASVAVSGELLLDYHDAVSSSTREYLRAIGPHDLDRVIDDTWEPPITLGARLVSVLEDNMQHVGQVSYVRGLLERGGICVGAFGAVDLGIGRMGAG